MACCRVICIALSLLVVFSACFAEFQQVWVTYDTQKGKFDVVNAAPKEYVAVASYNNSINSTGWAKLDVVTQAGPKMKYSDHVQAYAAGLAEGTITRSLMSMHWINTMAGLCPKPLTTKCLNLKKFLDQNLDWIKKQIASAGGKDPYWYQVQLMFEQITGLQDGYLNKPGMLNMDIDTLGVYLFQVDGDMEDLSQILSSGPAHDKSMTPDPWTTNAGRCSALIRLLPDSSDLYVSQVTWNSLQSMLRILKHYKFQLHLQSGYDILIPGYEMTFSSYPGFIMSGDDFYAISSGLLAQETTIGNSNPDLLKYITPQSVLEGIRNMVANRMASDGYQWSEIFSMHTSGTYNNQWMIIDYNKFEPKSKKLIDGTFYLLEQLPGTIVFKDMTPLLNKQGYFGSYNVPYFPEIFNKSGQPALVDKFGDWFTYDKNPRALIFKRDMAYIQNLEVMTDVMRYNDFMNDPLSKCNCTPPYSAENAISCRDDLNPANGTYPFSALGHRPHVATDMKLINADLFSSLSFLAISSPTYDNLPAFQWSKSDYNHKLSHVGHPDLWEFPVIMFNATTPMV